LLELANRALAGLQLPIGCTAAQVDLAVDNINRAFDGCRVLVDCATHTVIPDSAMMGLAVLRPPISDPGYLPATRSLSISLGGCNFRTRASNLNASKEPGEPDIAGNTGGKSLWWSGSRPLRTGHHHHRRQQF